MLVKVTLAILLCTTRSQSITFANVKAAYKCKANASDISPLTFTDGDWDPANALAQTCNKAPSQCQPYLETPNGLKLEDMIITILRRTPTLDDFQKYMHINGTLKDDHTQWTMEEAIYRGAFPEVNALNMTGKTALIIGGTASTGWNQATILAERGATVYVVGRDARWVAYNKQIAATNGKHDHNEPSSGTQEECAKALSDLGITGVNLTDPSSKFRHPLDPTKFLLPQTYMVGYTGQYNVPHAALDRIHTIEGDVRNVTFVDSLVDWVKNEFDNSNGVDIISMQQKTMSLYRTGNPFSDIDDYFQEVVNLEKGVDVDGDGVLDKGVDYAIKTNPKRGVGVPTYHSTTYEAKFGVRYFMAQLSLQIGTPFRTQTHILFAGSGNTFQKFVGPDDAYHISKQGVRGLYSKMLYQAAGKGIKATIVHPPGMKANQFYDIVMGVVTFFTRLSREDDLVTSKAAIAYGKMFKAPEGENGKFFYWQNDDELDTALDQVGYAESVRAQAWTPSCLLSGYHSISAMIYDKSVTDDTPVSSRPPHVERILPTSMSWMKYSTFEVPLIKGIYPNYEPETARPGLKAWSQYKSANIMKLVE